MTPVVLVTNLSPSLSLRVLILIEVSCLVSTAHGELMPWLMASEAQVPSVASQVSLAPP